MPLEALLENQPEREYLAGDEGRRCRDEEHAEPGDLTVVLCRGIREESISIISLKEQNNVSFKSISKYTEFRL